MLKWVQMKMKRSHLCFLTAGQDDERHAGWKSSSLGKLALDDLKIPEMLKQQPGQKQEPGDMSGHLEEGKKNEITWKRL